MLWNPWIRPCRKTRWRFQRRFVRCRRGFMRRRHECGRGGGRRHAAVGVPYVQTPTASSLPGIAERLSGRGSTDFSPAPSITMITSSIEDYSDVQLASILAPCRSVPLLRFHGGPQGADLRNLPTEIPRLPLLGHRRKMFGVPGTDPVNAVASAARSQSRLPWQRQRTPLRSWRRTSGARSGPRCLRS